MVTASSLMLPTVRSRESSAASVGVVNLSKVRLPVFPLGGRVARHRDRPDVPPMLAALIFLIYNRDAD
jgi:hypothetical protein